MLRTFVYLDFDGVILPLGGPALDAEGRRLGSDEPVEACNELVHGLDADIVVTSTWRIDRELEALRELLWEWGVRGPVVGATPQVRNVHAYDARVEEIARHVAEHRPDRVVVVDDAPLIPRPGWLSLRPVGHRGLVRAEVLGLLARLHR